MMWDIPRAKVVIEVNPESKGEHDAFLARLFDDNGTTRATGRSRESAFAAFRGLADRHGFRPGINNFRIVSAEPTSPLLPER